VFVSGEVDMVCSAGYNPARLERGWALDDLDIRRIYTNLGILDFGGPHHSPRLAALHPGVTAAQVQEATGFALELPAAVPQTSDPSPQELALLARLDPQSLRYGAMGA
jgi:glutaconate CoA-transferase subunit B